MFQNMLNQNSSSQSSAQQQVYQQEYTNPCSDLKSAEQTESNGFSSVPRRALESPSTSDVCSQHGRLILSRSSWESVDVIDASNSGTPRISAAARNSSVPSALGRTTPKSVKQSHQPVSIAGTVTTATAPPTTLNIRHTTRNARCTREPSTTHAATHNTEAITSQQPTNAMLLPNASEDSNTISQEILPTNIDNPVNLILTHSSAGSIKCTQINLQRAEAANTQLVQHVLDHEIDIILLQEPYCRNGAIACLPLSWKIFQRKAQLNELPPRAAIICCNPQWSPLIIKQARDHVAILLNYNNSQIILSSVYSSPPEDISNAVDSIAEIHRKHTTIKACFELEGQ
ncbi:uncharacterized protein LOC118205735 [Stegodyphus dumicola]|uniref:uncharacterized protein LOC118205735 n=1 Tax=Stegodyphus dumicola TaxID=202533 RepID=UPI0015ACE1F0|nr:uncharacterized protein LOC118205735 [Stegodyphus dumicola]